MDSTLPTKILCFALWVSIIILLNEVMIIGKCFFKMEKYKSKRTHKLATMGAIAYIMTIIMEGL